MKKLIYAFIFKKALEYFRRKRARPGPRS